jgi:ribonuclease-3
LEAGGGRENKTLLANTFEALLGGLFVDQGIEAGRAFVQETILSRTEKFLNEYGLKDPKSQLQETIQELHKVSPIYKIISEEGPDHAKLYTVGVYLNETLLAEGVGKSKQEAEKQAAAAALKSINI